MTFENLKLIDPILRALKEEDMPHLLPYKNNPYRFYFKEKI
jgi:hypothetical protein